MYDSVYYRGQKIISIWLLINTKVMNVHFAEHDFQEDSNDLKTDSQTFNCKVMWLLMLTASPMNWQEL